MNTQRMVDVALFSGVVAVAIAALAVACSSGPRPTAAQYASAAACIDERITLQAKCVLENDAEADQNACRERVRLAHECTNLDGGSHD